MKRLRSADEHEEKRDAPDAYHALWRVMGMSAKGAQTSQPRATPHIR